MSEFDEIQKLLQDKAEYQARINLIPYDGTPEIKEKGSAKYLYVRKRIGSRLTSTYVDVYSDDLYQLLLRNTRELRELKKNIRAIDRFALVFAFASGGIVQLVQTPRANRITAEPLTSAAESKNQKKAFLRNAFQHLFKFPPPPK